jgi:CheY-like chemotaxis protein
MPVSQKSSRHIPLLFVTNNDLSSFRKQCPANIVIIENNDKLAVIIRHYLLNKCLDADIASDGTAIPDVFSRTAHDLLNVEILLPGMNGRRDLQKDWE